MRFLVGLLAVACLLVFGASSHPAGAVDPPPWQRVVGGAVGNPVVVASTALDYSDAFVRTGTSLFHQRATAESVWEQDLGGIVTHDPAAASTPDGTYAVVVGADNAIYYRLVSDLTGLPGPWVSLGGISRRAPSAVTDSDGLVHVLVVGSDNAVWERSQEPGGAWGPWRSVGGISTSDIALASVVGPTYPVLSIAVRGADGGLWGNTSEAGVWGTYHSFGGRIVGSPAISPKGSEVAVRGTDNQVYLTGPSGLFATGGYITGDPSIAAVGPYTVLWQYTVYGRGPDGAIYGETWGRGRTGWFRVESNISSRVAAVVLDPYATCPDGHGGCAAGRFYVTAPDGALYTIFG